MQLSIKEVNFIEIFMWGMFYIDIENSGNYILFCPEFSKGQFGEGSDIINRIVHINLVFLYYLKRIGVLK